jgi:hypothetical protein
VQNVDGKIEDIFKDYTKRRKPGMLGIYLYFLLLPLEFSASVERFVTLHVLNLVGSR